MENLDKVLERVWQHASPEYKCLWKMEDEFLIFHTMTHMCYHFLCGGCGIRSFVDLYLLRTKTEYSEEVLRKYLCESEIEKFYDAVLSLLNVWFDNAEHTPLTLKMEEHIFEGGIYGNREKRIAFQQNKKGGRLGFVISRLFLPYETLAFYYPILNEKRWLTPFMQVRRWFRLLTRKGVYNRAKKELKVNSSISKDKINEASDFLQELGL